MYMPFDQYKMNYTNSIESKTVVWMQSSLPEEYMYLHIEQINCMLSNRTYIMYSSHMLPPNHIKIHLKISRSHLINFRTQNTLPKLYNPKTLITSRTNFGQITIRGILITMVPKTLYQPIYLSQLISTIIKK